MEMQRIIKFETTADLVGGFVVPASKQAFIFNKGLLLSDRSLSGRQLHSFSDFQDIDSLCLEKLYQPNVLQPRSPAMDYRGFCFCIKTINE